MAVDLVYVYDGCKRFHSNSLDIQWLYGIAFEKFYEYMLDWALLKSLAHKWLKKWQGYADKLEFNMFWGGPYAPVLENGQKTNEL